jgi:hypothetical protein
MLSPGSNYDIPPNNDPRRKASRSPQAVPVRSLLKSEMTLFCTPVIARTEPTTWEPAGRAVLATMNHHEISIRESWYSGKGHRSKPAVTSESERACSSNKERADGTRWRGCSWPEPEQDTDWNRFPPNITWWSDLLFPLTWWSDLLFPLPSSVCPLNLPEIIARHVRENIIMGIKRTYQWDGKIKKNVNPWWHSIAVAGHIVCED